MNTVIFNTICYSIEAAKFFLAMLLFDFEYQSYKKLFYTVLSTIAAVSIISFFVDLSDIQFAYTLFLMTGCFITLKKKIKIFNAAVIYIYICITDMIINGILMFLFKLSVEQIMNNTPLYIALNLPSLIIITLIMAINYKTNNTLYHHFPKSYIIILASGGLALAFYITPVQLFVFEENDENYLKIAALAISISSIVFIIIIALLIVNKLQNDNLKKENIAVIKTMKVQEEYYTMLLQKEQETKAFRHDTQAHLYCMQTLYNEGRLAEFEKYLLNLTSDFQELKSNFNTGNNLLNAIVNDIDAKFPDVRLSWTGFMPDKLSISSMDLCTVFSNILKNAFEAADRTDSKTVCVSVKIMESNLFVKITNSSVSAPVFSNDSYVSAKDTEGHGYGLSNVKKCLHRIGGSFTLSYEDGIAASEVILSNVILV